MNTYLLAALLLTSPAWAAPGATLEDRWHLKDQSQVPQEKPMRIYEADEFTPIDAMAAPMKPADVCAEKGLRKVVNAAGWRCRK